MRLKSGKYKRLEFFAKKNYSQSGNVILKKEENILVKICVTDDVHHFYGVDLEEEKEYILLLEDVDVPYAYLCGNDDLLEKGIGFLSINEEENKFEVIDIGKFHDSLIKEQYHFIPVKNWLNDPNGLCLYKNKYHMYYQANPVMQKADFCYWGHTVSEDLIHWKYMPIAVFPQNELLENSENRGGAFSGSALVEGDILHIFFTRHLGRKNNLKDFCEYQVEAVSTDSIHFQKEKIIIASKPEEEMTCDFRDPKVTFVNGKLWIVLAGGKNGHAILMGYSSEDMKSWKYEGIILSDKRAVCYECPDLFQLGEKMIAIGALMDYVDEDGHFRPTRYYLGQIKDGKFCIEAENNIDFGLNLYATQSFQSKERRILIGWIADFNNEHIFKENGCYGSMSIPRELSVKNQKLYMKPVQEIYTLLGEEVNVLIKDSCCAEVGGNSYYAVIKLKNESKLNILIAQNDKDELRLLWNNGIAEMVSTRDKGARYRTCLEKLDKIEIFFDRRVAEVFLNDGEAVGTRIFYTMQTTGRCSVQVSRNEHVEEIKIFKMNSIWKGRKGL